MIRRLLIANRGEIAVRIARTARERGITTIAVYSDADRESLHVRQCDEAFSIGPAAAAESYLSIPSLLAAARAAAADAIHPGYGFLSENADFATAVSESGLVWVGPSPEAIRAMGDKVAARELMRAAGLPVVPGFEPRGGGPDGEFQEGAGRIGYPVLVKASAGGGGKGMRVVSSPSELGAALAAARREAAAAFGDAAIYLEKAIDRPRHVEIQIFGDRFGVRSLFERECSVQRRHQKIVEESPCSVIDGETRRRMSEAAVRAGEAVGYVGAGTVEFLLDRNGEFYFLEMNTRLQVEHPVTEEVLSLDLVAAQLEVAAGSRLPAAFAGREPRGHAIECRLYAEDPRTFLPRSGPVLAYEEPRGPGVRVDSGIDEGSFVGVDYDPLLAKIIVCAQDRPSAIARMRRALAETIVLGVETNLDLLARVLNSSEFERGETDTGLVGRLGLPELSEPPRAALEAAAWCAGGAPSAGEASRRTGDPWAELDGWRGP